MKRLVNKYSEFIFEKKENSLKGISYDNMIKKIEEVVRVLPSTVQFGVPSDNLGQSTSYKSPADAIQRIKDIAHYYEKRKEKVRFYCWSITFKGDFNASQELEDKMIEADGLFHENQKKYGKIDYTKGTSEGRHRDLINGEDKIIRLDKIAAETENPKHGEDIIPFAFWIYDQSRDIGEPMFFRFRNQW